MFKRVLLVISVLCVILVFLSGCGKISEQAGISKELNTADTFSKMSADAPLRKIIVFQKVISKSQKVNILTKHDVQIIKHLDLIDAVAARVPDQAKEKVLSALSRRIEIVRIDDDLIVHAFKKPPHAGGGKPKPEEPAEILPWGIDRIDADLVWGSSQGTGVKVAIVDTGIDYKHPDLQANVKGGVNMINPKKSYKDDNGHGTHVSGIVAAIDNEIGVIGVGPMISLYGVKVLNRQGTGFLSDVIDGLQWCINNDIHVINLSLGSGGDNQSFHDAILNVNQAGIVQIAAAGNEGGAVAYPARYPETIAVSAINNADQLAGFSNFGPEIDITAPGAEIYSTYKDSSYKSLDGTSMSAPHVAGACALKLALNPALSPAEVKNVLQASAESLGGLTTEQQGAGLVDVEQMMRQ